MLFPHHFHPEAIQIVGIYCWNSVDRRDCMTLWQVHLHDERDDRGRVPHLSGWHVDLPIFVLNFCPTVCPLFYSSHLTDDNWFSIAHATILRTITKLQLASECEKLKKTHNFQFCRKSKHGYVYVSAFVKGRGGRKGSFEVSLGFKMPFTFDKRASESSGAISYACTMGKIRAWITLVSRLYPVRRQENESTGAFWVWIKDFGLKYVLGCFLKAVSSKQLYSNWKLSFQSEVWLTFFLYNNRWIDF